MQINNLLKWEQRVCSHATAEPDKIHETMWGLPVCLQSVSQAEQGRPSCRRFCEVENPSVFKIRSAVCHRLLTNNELSFWVRALATEVYATHDIFIHPESRVLKIHLILHLIYIPKNCITDCCYLSLHQCRDPNEQNFINNLLLFKLVWEQKKLYLCNFSSE